MLIGQLGAKTTEFKQLMHQAINSINNYLIEPIEKDGIYADIDITVLQSIETSALRLYGDISRLRELLNVHPYSERKIKQ